MNKIEYPESRSEAKRLGSKYYFTGKECKRGHNEIRITADGRCVQCSREYASRYYHERGGKEYQKSWVSQNKERVLEREMEWNKNNPEKRKKYRTDHYHRNKERYDSQSKEWKIKNPEKTKQMFKNWRDKNAGLKAAQNIRRQRALKNATPPWADMEKINEIYRNRPEGYHVDHIVPLKGINVQGFHVEYNLQYLPAKENLSKGNRV